jgi:hypothetical protein
MLHNPSPPRVAMDVRNPGLAPWDCAPSPAAAAAVSACCSRCIMCASHVGRLLALSEAADHSGPATMLKS